MPAAPYDWNVVVVAAWNPAILTPNGIARRLFALEPGTPVDVQVPVDQQAPIRVHYAGITVSPSRNLLVIQPTTSSADMLQRAAEIATRAIEQLPETPMEAAGVNVRFKLAPTPDELLRVLESPADDALADMGYTIRRRALQRTLTWAEGVLNIELSYDNDSAAVALNFHLDSTDPTSLRGWLGRVGEMVATARATLGTTVHVAVVEGENA